MAFLYLCPLARHTDSGAYLPVPVENVISPSQARAYLLDSEMGCAFNFKFKKIKPVTDTGDITQERAQAMFTVF